MHIFLYQTHHSIGDFEGIFQDLKKTLQDFADPLASAPSLHLYPELYLTGYPLKDLVIQKDFINAYLKHFKQLSQFCLSQSQAPAPHERAALVGGLDYHFDEDGLPYSIKNVIYEFRLGSAPRKIYTKALLPNYDIFDEKKYFSPEYAPVIYSFAGLQIGTLICEDMWFNGFHQYNPAIALYQKCLQTKTQLDLVVNLSASPYFLGKQQLRVERAGQLSRLLQAPFAYINRVGGEDEVQFDGSSFLINGTELVYQCTSFKEEKISLPLPSFPKALSSPSSQEDPLQESQKNWELLLRPNLNFTTPLPSLTPLSPNDCQEIIQAMGLGLLDYARKCGFKRFLVAVSGGIDSALVLSLLKIILKPLQKEFPLALEAVYMPGHYSQPLSWQLSRQLCQNLQVKLVSLPIKFFHNAIKLSFKDSFGEELEGLANENIQSRLRGSLLYTRSNQTQAMVINTSNKSELGIGYSTLHGDSVGGISLLGDLYKTEVYQLSEYINQNYNAPIPAEILTRPPSAELRENQTDEQSLPPYQRLDPILEGLLSYRYTAKDLIQCGFSAPEVYKIYKLYLQSEYKRSQFCPIIKLRTKSFGSGHRVPLARSSSYSFETECE